MNPLCIPLAFLAAILDLAGLVFLARHDHPLALAAFTAAGLAGLAGLQLYYN